MIEVEIQRFMAEKGQTLALAESCTGGGVSARIVKQPDCSIYFLGSLVSYSKAAKIKILGVPESTLNSYGEVSAETAQAMALGALEKFNSTYGLSITGLAGPSGGTSEKPIGTVFIAAASTKSLSFERFLFQGSREEIISQAIESALQYLWKYLNP